jgi:hypothetical protein
MKNIYSQPDSKRRQLNFFEHSYTNFHTHKKQQIIL